MQDSNRPSKSSGGSRGPLYIIVVGIVVLVAAGLVLYKKRSPAPNPTVEKNTVIKEKATAPPLVIVEPSKPSNGNGKNQHSGGPNRESKREPLGTIDVAAVNTFINVRFGQLRACYERRLKVDSSLKGTLDLNISIASTGKVNWVSVNRNTVRDSKMLSCVRRTIRSWDFPKPQGGRVIVAKTFHFKKKS